jgi:hypothetical protein
MPRHPARIGIGGVDQVEPGVDEGIQQQKRSRLVDRPAEHVAAESEWRDLESGTPQLAFFHGRAFAGKM